ncbi:site-specific integrase [Natranaeroarchaeum sulfidigenes]|uniref:XerD/XerC family integrase n=1 Tax=Natranaeroarchaeum sulfidigenes TaxID=2784880 RepID=A0A897MKV2_9EURY|nr:site-specific integrase [Natranaeroarchaeum sulfidigenes]QSG02770.1 XerD/XerC family integrase [Natranaeroarchaeum sulfidigenes]
MSSRGRSEDQILVDEQFKPLNSRQQDIYSAVLSRFKQYLETEGKNPKKGLGYSKVNERISRFHRVMKWVWNNETITTEFTTEDADIVNEALAEDSFRRMDGGRYAEGSKRKINDVIVNWFEFQGIDWDPETRFHDEPATENADPFRKSELQQLWQTSLTYKSVPSYNNLSPEDRDRWKAHIAQELGKPKVEVTPSDWDTLNKDWKVPSLVRTTRGAGWRPDLIGRMSVEWYDPEAQRIYIPEGEAPKNDDSWEQELSQEGAHALDNWLDQRANQEMYDGRDEIWLTREGNPYTSASLNDLLDNLVDEAGIDEGNRKIVWYSFRHSIGTYVYDKYKDRRVVAETLRQNSTAAADRYIHPLPELKQEVADLM